MTPFTSSKINLTLNRLFEYGFLPAEGTFEITEDLLNKYIRIYKKLNTSGNSKFEWWYARKIAGVTLLKLKLYRGDTYKTAKEGIIYGISNPAWNNHLKIGITIDHKKRLASLQTGDPFRAYKIDGYEFVADRRKIEKDVLNNFNVHLVNGEWLKISNARLILDYVKDLIKADIKDQENINKSFGLRKL